VQILMLDRTGPELMRFVAKTRSAAESMARSLEWDAAPLEQRLAQYSAGQPWRGNLLEFQAR
jgi:hypothetical protein